MLASELVRLGRLQRPHRRNYRAILLRASSGRWQMGALLPREGRVQCSPFIISCGLGTVEWPLMELKSHSYLGIIIAKRMGDKSEIGLFSLSKICSEALALLCSITVLSGRENFPLSADRLWWKLTGGPGQTHSSF